MTDVSDRPHPGFGPSVRSSGRSRRHRLKAVLGLGPVQAEAASPGLRAPVVPPPRRVKLGAPIGERSFNFMMLFALTIILNVIGLVMVFSASTITGLESNGSTLFFFQRQLMWALLGLAMMILVMRIDYRRLAPLAVPGMIAACCLLLIVLMPGVGVGANGSTRWLGLGGFAIQPAEFAKVAVALFAAWWLAERVEDVRDSRTAVRPVLLFSLLVAVLILLQRSQGTAMIVMTIAFIMLFAAGASLRPMIAVGVLLTLAASYLAIREPYRLRRLMAFRDPWGDELDSGYQTIQSLVGVASGGVSGVGLGAGRAKWGFLPFAHTDFIFAVISEELGLIGATMVILAFVGVAWFGWRTAMAAPDRFGMLLAAGITTWISFQAFINIGVSLGVLPISGVTLPFVSIGGSSLVATMLGMGIVLNVARQPGISSQRRRARAGHPVSGRAVQRSAGRQNQAPGRR